MKYLIVILSFFAILAFANNTGISVKPIKQDTVPTGAAPQLFGSKLYEFRNYALIDSFLMIAEGDTFAYPRWPAIKFKSSDKRWYGHDKSKWQRFLYASDTSTLLATRYDLTQLPQTILSNVGSGYRLVTNPNGSIKTIANSNTVIWDSTSNANSLTAKVDTAVIATQYDIAQLGVFNTYYAYVDTLGNDATGALNNAAKPFKTINAALDALPSQGGVIPIGLGKFNSPDSAKMKSNVWFKGSGMPVANDTMTVNAYYNNTIKVPTRLIGGTILTGSFIVPYNREHIHCTDLGVDVGSDWVANVNGGVEVDGFMCPQFYNPAGGLPSADGKHLLQTQTKPRRGMLFKNINVLLSSATSPYHAFLLENMTFAIADNIYTTYGFAGVVIKTMGGIYTNLHTRGHGTYHIIPKSNDYSYCYGVVINGFECGPILGNNGTGITLDQNDPGSPGIYWCNISNGFINHVGTGMSLTGDNMNISNINIVDVGISGVVSANLIRSHIDNITQRIAPQQGFSIDPGSILSDGATTWSNCTAIGNLGDGFRVLNGTAKNYFENIISGENTGYGFNSNGTAWVGNHTYYSNTAGATTGTMHNRVAVTSLLSAGTGISLSGSGTEASPYSISSSYSAPITSINSQTGPAITITAGTAITTSTLSNDITIAYDKTNSEVYHTLANYLIDANNSGTAETDLYSTTVGANKLISNGQSLSFEISGTFNDITATADVQFYFAGASFGNTGALTISTTGAWSARGMIIRTTSTTARAYVTITTPGASTAEYTNELDLTGLDFTTSNVFKVTAQAGGAGGGSNDITAKLGKLKFESN